MILDGDSPLPKLHREQERLRFSAFGRGSLAAVIVTADLGLMKERRDRGEASPDPFLEALTGGRRRTIAASADPSP